MVSMTRRRSVIVVIVLLVISLIHNVHWLTAVISAQERVEVIVALNGTEKKIQSSSLSPYHVVYCILKPRDVAVMDYATLEAIAPTNIKAVTQNGGNFHILTNDGQRIRSILSNSTISKDEMASVTIQDFMENESSLRFRTFRERYISQTVNSVVYEELCMLRWIMVDDYFQGLREKGVTVDRILAIDTDVLLTADPRRLLNTVPTKEVDELESIMIRNGAAMAWSTKGLETFVTFLINVYATKESAIAIVQQFGDAFPFCRPEGAVLIPCVTEDNQMWHISDMHILNAWFHESESLALTRLVWSYLEERQCLVLQPVWSATKMAASLEGVHFQKHKSSIKSTNLENGNATDVCLVHFQGESKKLVPRFLSFMTEGNQSSFSTR